MVADGDDETVVVMKTEALGSLELDAWMCAVAPYISPLCVLRIDYMTCTVCLCSTCLMMTHDCRSILCVCARARVCLRVVCDGTEDGVYLLDTDFPRYNQ